METVPFDTAWKRFTGGEPPGDMSGELLPFLEQLYLEIARRPPRLVALRVALHNLLAYLASSAGRTDANCRTTDFFLCLSDEVDWSHLPGDFTDILADMVGALHDTVSSPAIAANFDSTPEQLLRRLPEVHENEGAV